MELMEAIRTRHSVRHYEDKPVPGDLVEAMLLAGMCAPSAMNQRPWHFLVIDDKATLTEITRQNEHAEMCAEAPLAILVCADTRDLQAPALWPQDCAAAAQNILLVAHDAGLGAVWTGAYPADEAVRLYREMFRLPEGVLPQALIVIGYPAEQKEPGDRYQPSRVHRNAW